MVERNLGFAAQQVSQEMRTISAVIDTKRQPSSINGELAGNNEIEVYNESRGSGRRLFFIPLDIRRAGQLLRQAREVNCVGAGEIAHIISKPHPPVSSTFIEAFEEGRIREPDLGKIITAAERYIDSEDERIKELKDILNRREDDKKWIRTLIRPGMNAARSIQALRLALGLTQQDFARKTKVSKRAIEKFESGKTTPKPATLEQIIQGSELASDGKPAQVLRSQVLNIELKKSQDLQEMRLGEILSYLRRLKGGTQKEVGAKIGYSQPDLKDIEQHKKTMRESALQAFIDWLELTPDSPLVTILWQKWNNPQKILDEDCINDVLSEKYLFAENLEKIVPYALTKKELRLKVKLERRQSVGERLKTLRERFFSIPAFAYRIGVAPITISRIERGDSLPELTTVTKFVKKLGYDIHHPIMWLLWDQLSEEIARSYE